MSKHHSKETKIEALSRLVRGDDAEEICRDYQITKNTLSNWKKRAHDEQPKELLKTPVGALEGKIHQLQKHPDSEMYSTRIMQVGAALCMAGFEVENTTQGSDFKKILHFKNSPQLQRVVEEYWSGDLVGSLKDFNNKIYELMGKRVSC